MRKSLVLACGGYRDQFPHAEDLDLFLRLAEVGRLANLPEVLLDYRQYQDSIGYRHTEAQRDSARRAVAEAKTRRGCGGAEKEPDEGWASSGMTIAAVHRRWGWWALAGRNLPTARKHAFIALRLQPFDLENWKLIACVFRGYRKKSSEEDFFMKDVVRRARNLYSVLSASVRSRVFRKKTDSLNWLVHKQIKIGKQVISFSYRHNSEGDCGVIEQVFYNQDYRIEKCRKGAP